MGLTIWNDRIRFTSPWAIAPSTPTTIVAAARTSSRVLDAEGGNSSVWVRMMAYTPTLVSKQPGEYGRHRRGRRRVAVRQPEEQREDRRLDAEHHQHQHGQGAAQAVGRSPIRSDSSAMFMVPVEAYTNASSATNSTEASIDHHVGHARAHLLQPAPQRQQHVAGGHTISMATNSVNRSPVRKAAATPGQDQVHGLEADAVALGPRLADGVDQHGQQHHRRHHQHHGRQPVTTSVMPRGAVSRRPPTTSARRGRRPPAERARATAQRRARRPARRASPSRIDTRASARGTTGRAARPRPDLRGIGDDVVDGHVGVDVLGVGVDVGQLVVRACRAIAAVLQVVLDLVVAGQQPAPVGERQQQGADAEADHDGRQRQRLGQRVGHVPVRAVADDRRPPLPPRRDHQDAGAVAEQGDADDPAQLALQDKVGPQPEQGGSGGGQQDCHDAGTRGSSPKDSNTISTRPSTTRYTPASKASAEVTFRWPRSGRSASRAAFLQHRPPKGQRDQGGGAATASPAPSTVHGWAWDRLRTSSMPPAT